MKQLMFVAFVALVPFSQVLGETEIEMKEYSESLVNEFKSLSAKEAFEFWKEHQEPTQANHEMLRFSLENDRFDFLKLMFEDHVTNSYVIDSVKEMPPSEKRDKMVIAMLRWDCMVFWHGEVPESDDFYAYGVILDNAVEPFVGVIRKHLPHVEINEKLFSTKEKRMKLAADLENAMSDGSSTQRGERPKKRNELPEAVETQTSANQEGAKQSTVSKTSQQPTPKPTSVLRWV
jgi:hypothetical protein